MKPVGRKWCVCQRAIRDVICTHPAACTHMLLRERLQENMYCRRRHRLRMWHQTPYVTSVCNCSRCGQGIVCVDGFLRCHPCDYNMCPDCRDIMERQDIPAAAPDAVDAVVHSVPSPRKAEAVDSSTTAYVGVSASKPVVEVSLDSTVDPDRKACDGDGGHHTAPLPLLFPLHSSTDVESDV